MWTFSPPDEYQLEGGSTTPMSLPEQHTDSASDMDSMKVEDDDSIMDDVC